MSYHLFLHEYDAAGGMNDYVGVFENFDAILDRVVHRKKNTSYEGEIAQLKDGKLEIVGYVCADFKFEPPRKTSYYWIELEDGTKTEKRVVVDLFYTAMETR